MGKTLAEMLSDANFGDDLVIKINDNEVKLGDVRSYARGKESEVATLRAKAKSDAEEAAAVLGALKKAQEEFNAVSTKRSDDGVKKTGEDWKSDPLYAPLVGEFEALHKMAKDSLATSQSLKEALDKSQAVYGFERLRRQWAEAKVKPANVSFEDAAKEILTAKEVDEFGLPTLEKYLYRKSEPDRIKAAVDEAVGKAKKEWDDAQRLANIPKPGSQTKFAVRDGGKPPIEKLDQLTSEKIANDPDILKAMELPVQ